MKDSKVWAPPGIRRERIREKTKVGTYLIVDSITALVALVQMGVLELHTWNSQVASIERPDRVVIDLDPGPQIGWREVIAAARLVRRLLQELELDSFPKTTGGRGIHAVVPLTPRADWSECLNFARAFTGALVRRHADTFTAAFAKAGREDRILVDYKRNSRTNRSVAAFSTRAKPDAPVSVPVAWHELTAAREPGRFAMTTVPGRLARLRADPWKTHWTTRQRILRAAIRALERL
jgi:bifunctional non-homologous end joining protein LigD